MFSDSTTSPERPFLKLETEETVKVTIEIRDEWPEEVARAISDAGSNDDEHDLLMEVADEVHRTTGIDIGAMRDQFDDQAYEET